VKTIGVELWGGQQRGGGANVPTVCRSAQRDPRQHRLPGRPPRELRELFQIAYGSFAPACRAVTEPGVAIVAVDETSGRPMGMVRVLARVDRHVTAIVGRHDKADLYLDAFDGLALRHLAVIVDPVQSWQRGAAIGYRVLDLRTADGFVDERGTTLRGLRGEGPALLRCAGYALFVLPLGDVTDWPDSPADAWSFLPERIYFDEINAFAEGTATALPRALGHHSVAMVRTQGPRDVSAELITGGDQVADLEIIGPDRRIRLRVGAVALREGILVGRYDRCQGALADGGDPSLSRVHLLIIEVGDRRLAIDTASTCGTTGADGHRARVVALAGPATLTLAHDTILRWLPR
jgi:hypothetical protein